MSEDQIVERVARLILPDKKLWDGTGVGHAYEPENVERLTRKAMSQARRVVQGLGLHEEHEQPYTYQHGANAGQTVASTRLVTDWQEDLQ